MYEQDLALDNLQELICLKTVVIAPNFPFLGQKKTQWFDQCECIILFSKLQTLWNTILKYRIYATQY